MKCPFTQLPNGHLCILCVWYVSAHLKLTYLKSGKTNFILAFFSQGLDSYFDFSFMLKFLLIFKILPPLFTYNQSLDQIISLISSLI